MVLPLGIEIINDNLTLPAGIDHGLRHNLMPYRSHLRTVIRADDLRHNITAEGRPSLDQYFLFFIDIEAGAIGSQPGV